MLRCAFLVSLVAAACSFKGGFDGTHYKCGAGDTCPTGQTCVAGECVSGPDVPDAPPGAADAPIGTPDAPTQTAACGTLGALRDDFTVDRLGTIWDRWSDGGPTATVTTGYLSISIPTNTSDLGAGYSSSYYYDFTGSEARATISKIADVDTILEVRDWKGGKLQMVVESGTLYAGVFGNALTTTGDRNSVTYDAAVHKHWRIREQGGTAFWEWSTDGSMWNELWHETDPIRPQHVLIELSADGNGPSEARFEDFNVGAPTATLCAADSITDDFLNSTFDPKWLTWADTGASVAETGGGAVISTDGADNEYAGFQTRHLFDLTAGSYYLDASSVAQVNNAYSSWMQAMVPGNGSTLFEMGVDGTSLNMDQQVNGAQTDGTSVTYDPVAHKYWRLRADATHVYWDTSPDASAWTMLYSAPARLDPSAVIFVMGAGDYNPTTAQTFRIGSVNVP